MIRGLVHSKPAKNERLGRCFYETHMVTGKSWMQHSRLAAMACRDRAAFAFREHFLVKKIE